MCNCVEKINGKVKEKLNVDNGSVLVEMFSGKTYSEFQFINEKGKNKSQLILHSHCPFCGEPYEKKEVSNETVL